MTAIQLHHAWRWECPACGFPNFEEGEPHKMTAKELEEQADLMRFTGEARAAFLEGWVGVECHLAPVRLTCDNCGAEGTAEEESEE